MDGTEGAQGDGMIGWGTNCFSSGTAVLIRTNVSHTDITPTQPRVTFPLTPPPCPRARPPARHPASPSLTLTGVPLPWAFALAIFCADVYECKGEVGVSARVSVRASVEVVLKAKRSSRTRTLVLKTLILVLKVAPTTLAIQVSRHGPFRFFRGALRTPTHVWRIFLCSTT